VAWVGNPTFAQPAGIADDVMTMSEEQKCRTGVAATRLHQASKTDKQHGK
jgi:hypothetical protein